MLEKFLTILKSTISSYADKNYLLAVSGGVDSMVLLALFQQAELKFSVAHCNFGLRGEVSEGEQVMLQEYCQKYQIAFHTQRFYPLITAKEKGISMQMAARDLRYEWFEKLKDEHSYDFLVTAHHADDQAETILLNLTRGTGLKGLRGMAVLQNDRLRPLISIAKQDLVAFAESEGLTWSEDVSNASDAYYRNQIRHHVVPVLKQINPSFFDGISHLHERLSMIDQYLDLAYEEFKFANNCQQEEVKIPKSFLTEPDKKLFLYRYFEELDFNYSQIDQIFHANHLSGKVFNSPMYQLVFDREHLILSKFKAHKPQEYLIGETGYLETADGWQFKFELIPNQDLDYSDRSKFYLNAARLTFPLKLRKWQIGDKMRPFGMRGHRLISDIFIDLKASVLDKEKAWILEDDEIILALLPYRSAETCRIFPAAKEVFCVSVSRL